VATENALHTGSQDPEFTSENTDGSSRRRPGRAPIALPASQTAVLADYIKALRSAPLSDQTRRTYTSKVRQYLAWLADADLDQDGVWGRTEQELALRVLDTEFGDPRGD
jgi:hypothetical protein